MLALHQCMVSTLLTFQFKIYTGRLQALNRPKIKEEDCQYLRSLMQQQDCITGFWFKELDTRQLAVWRRTEIPNRKCGGRSLNWWLFAWFRYYWISMFPRVLNTRCVSYWRTPTDCRCFSMGLHRTLVGLMAITRRPFHRMPTLASLQIHFHR